MWWRPSSRTTPTLVTDGLEADPLAVADLVAALGAVADEQRVAPGAAVDAAAPEVRVDRVVVGPGDDDVAPVAGVDEVRARAPVEVVDLGRALAGGLVVAPQDVGALAAVDGVGVVAAQELVALAGAGDRVVAVVLVDLQRAVDLRPAVVARVGIRGAAGDGGAGECAGGDGREALLSS